MFRLLKCESCNMQKYIIKQNISAIKCVCLFCTYRKCYYNTLGLDSTASSKDIKSAYYKLSLQYHPDKNNGCLESVAKFREITEAYEVLSNAEKKTQYDSNRNFKRYDSPTNAYNQTYSRTRNFRGPFTGKTKDFDYDEHFKQHYEELQKRRQAEHEYFKRRWEAEFYNRYPNFKDYYYRRTDPEAERRENYEKFRQQLRATRRYYYFTISTLFLILSINIFIEMLNPETSRMYRRPHPVYYDIRKSDDADETDSEKRKTK